LKGFEAIEKELCSSTGPYALGHSVTVADLCIVPQVYNARRFNVNLERFPRILAVEEACLALKPFQTALPENQPDAQ
jgi:glutathione S-transferase